MTYKDKGSYDFHPGSIVTAQMSNDVKCGVIERFMITKRMCELLMKITSNNSKSDEMKKDFK